MKLSTLLLSVLLMAAPAPMVHAMENQAPTIFGSIGMATVGFSLLKAANWLGETSQDHTAPATLSQDLMLPAAVYTWAAGLGLIGLATLSVIANIAQFSNK